MTSPGEPTAHGYDPEATVLMPVVPVDGPAGADTTLLMPVIAPPEITPGGPGRRAEQRAHAAADAPTAHVEHPPVFRRPDARPPDAADFPTEVLAPAVPAAPAAPATPAGAPGWHDMIDRGAANAPTEVVAAPDAWPAAPTDAPPAVPDAAPAWPVGVPAASPESTLGPTGPTDAIDEQPSVARSSAIMAVGSLVSRVTGLARTIVLSIALGGMLVGNNYNLANTLPNMVYELLLGGVLASVLVPFLVRARIADHDRGQAYAQRLLTLATLLLGGATILAVACAPLLTRLFLSFSQNADQADPHQVTTLSYLILPEIFFYGMAALFAAILNTRGHFAAPTFTPILNNLVVILTGVAVMVMPFAAPLVVDGVSQPQITMAQTLVLGVGTTLGIVVQAVGLWPAMRRVQFRWKWRFDFRPLRLRALGRASVWMLLYVAISQIALVVLLILLTAASDNGKNAGLTVYNNAFLIFMMAHGIVAVSIMTALMPRLSAAAAEHRFGDVAAQFSQGTRLSAVILMPATAAYIVLGRPLAVTLFEHGKFSHADALKTGTVIAVSALGLVPFAISQMQLFAFYAMPDTKTPALLNIPVAALRIGLDVLFYFVLPATAFAASLMGANTVSYVLGVVLGYALLRRRIGRLGLGRTWRALARLAVAAAVGGLAAWLVVLGVDRVLGGSVGALVELVAGGIVLGVVYLGAAMALKARDVTDVFAMVKGRLGR